MCPDKALLSAWYDGEVEEPWKEEIEQHVSQCHRCRAVIEDFSLSSRFLENDQVILSRYKKKEIYRQVMHQHRRSNILPLWQKQLPWPVVAAVLILGLSLVLPAYGGMGRSGSTQKALALREEADLSALEELVPIMLPPEQSFSYYGDSQLLKTASFEKVAP